MEYYGTGRKEFTNTGSFSEGAKDTIVQEDVTVTISNMRTAIASTHVILIFAIMPNLILIPSDLRILTEPIPGFSNVLTVAKNGMTFGRNEKVNHTGIKPVKHFTNSTDISPNASHNITPIPTAEDLKPLVENKPELRQKSDSQNIVLGMIAAAFFGLAYFVLRR